MKVHPTIVKTEAIELVKKYIHKKRWRFNVMNQQSNNISCLRTVKRKLVIDKSSINAITKTKQRTQHTTGKKE